MLSKNLRKDGMTGRLVFSLGWVYNIFTNVMDILLHNWPRIYSKNLSKHAEMWSIKRQAVVFIALTPVVLSAMRRHS